MAAAVAVLFACCTSEELTDSSDVTLSDATGLITFSLGTDSTDTDDTEESTDTTSDDLQTDEEKELSTVYAVIFRDTNRGVATSGETNTEEGTEVFYGYEEIDITSSTTYSLTIEEEGHYQICFVANPSAGLLSGIDALTTSSTVADFKGIVISDQEPDVTPMIMVSENFYGVKTTDGASLGTVYLERIMSRIDIVNLAVGVTVDKAEMTWRSVQSVLINDDNTTQETDYLETTAATYDFSENPLVGTSTQTDGVSASEYASLTSTDGVEVNASKSEIYSYEQFGTGDYIPVMTLTYHLNSDEATSYTTEVPFVDSSDSPLYLERNHYYLIRLGISYGNIVYTVSVADWEEGETLTVSNEEIVAIIEGEEEEDEETVSYYELYTAGETLTIGNLEINLATYGEATLISSDSESTEIAAAGVYFIDSDVEASYTGTGGYSELIIIGNDSSQKSTLDLSSVQIKISNGAEGVLALYNLVCDASEFTAATYLIAQNYDGAFANVVFDSCEINLAEGLILTYISSASRSIDNFYMCNCVLPYSATSSNSYIISGAAASSYGSATFKNNVFYCTVSGSAPTNFKLINGSTTTFDELTIENNTFINMYCSTSYYAYHGTLTTANISNNLIWCDAEMANAMGVLRCATTYPTGGTCTDNIYYKGDSSSYIWRVIYGGASVNGFDGAEEITAVSDDPFSGGTFDLSSGTFVPGSSYSSYGASID